MRDDPSLPKKRRGTRLKRTHQADRDSQRLFAEAQQISLSQEQGTDFLRLDIEELRKIGHGPFCVDVAELASTYVMSRAVALGKAQVKADRRFLKRVQNKANHLLGVLAEKPAQPLLLYGSMAHIPEELRRLLEEIEFEQRVLTAVAQRVPNYENLQVVHLLRKLFNKHGLTIANSREGDDPDSRGGAFCRCLGLILKAAGCPVTDPYHLIESWQRFSEEVPRSTYTPPI